MLHDLSMTAPPWHGPSRRPPGFCSKKLGVIECFISPAEAGIDTSKNALATMAVIRCMAVFLIYFGCSTWQRVTRPMLMTIRKSLPFGECCLDWLLSIRNDLDVGGDVIGPAPLCRNRILNPVRLCFNF